MKPKVMRVPPDMINPSMPSGTANAIRNSFEPKFSEHLPPPPYRAKEPACSHVNQSIWAQRATPLPSVIPTDR